MRDTKRADMSGSEKFIVWCDRAMAFSFYALIYFLPISIALTETFSGLAIFFYLLKRGTLFFYGFKTGSSGWASFFSSFKPAENYLNKPLAIFLVINFLAVITSQFPRVSIEGFVGKALQGVFTYFAFIEAISTKKRIKTFLVIFAISFLLICVNGLYQYFLGHDFIRGHIFDGRISSSFRAANDFAAYLVVTTPVLFYLSLFSSPPKDPKDSGSVYFSFLSSGKIRLILFFLFVLSFACLILTYSRGGWLAFLLCLSVLGIKSRKVFLFSVVFIVIFLFSFYSQSTRVIPSENNWRTYFDWENNRLKYWTRSVSIIKDYPFLGSGLNTYSSIQWKYETGWGGYPHNSYLQMTAETGLTGLAAFLWVIIVLLRNSFRNLKRITDQSVRPLLLSFLAGLAGFFIHSFFDTNFYSVQLGSFMWLLMGLVVALQYVEEPNPENPGS